MVAANDVAALAADHGQRHLQLPRGRRAGMRDAAIDADFRGRVEAQLQPLLHRLQAVLYIGIEAVGVEMAEQ
ncbi:hypothetical protein D3C71_2129900 [compost metagenome]